MRRNIYLRLLLSIVGITVLVMGVQLAILFVSTKIAERTWKAHVFDGYVETLSSTFQDSSLLSVADLFYILVDSAPDRVSGLLIRDESGDVSISIGSSSRGDFIPQMYDGGRLLDYYNSSAMAFPKAFSVSVNTTEDYALERINAPKYSINLTTHMVGRNLIVDDIVVMETGDDGYSEVKIPSVIKDNDIAGTLVLYNNGTVYGYIDIIVFDIDVYGPTEILLKDFSSKVLIFLPIAVLISLIAGYFISKRNANMIREIRRALRELAMGNYKVEVNRNLVNYDDFSMIADSIEQLGVDLDRHRKSRKEWLRNISHDLNTPVTSMNLLLSGAEDGIFPINENLIASIKSENDVLISRIASVAYYSSLINGGDYPVKMVQMDINEVISAAIGDREGYSFKAESPLLMKFDFDLVKRALKEVFDNADKYGRRDEPVQVKAYGDCSSISIEIVNKGSLPQPRPPFFEPWARGDESRHEGGSGLGLPIVHQIMEMHHGAVSIDEKDGHVFVKLTFPL